MISPSKGAKIDVSLRVRLRNRWIYKLKIVTKPPKNNGKHIQDLKKFKEYVTKEIVILNQN